MFVLLPVLARYLPFPLQQHAAQVQTQQHCPGETRPFELEQYGERVKVASESCLHLPNTALGPVQHSISRDSLRYVPTNYFRRAPSLCATTKIERGGLKFAMLFESDEEHTTVASLREHSRGHQATYSQLDGVAKRLSCLSSPRYFTSPRPFKLPSILHLHHQEGRHGKRETWLTQTAVSRILRSRPRPVPRPHNTLGPQILETSPKKATPIPSAAT